MNILSLNEAYEKNAFIYLCNGCGEVKDPNNPGRVCEPEEIPSVLSLKERVLYENYWSEGTGALMYVLRLADNTPAMGVGFLFSSGWCRELAEKVSGRKDIGKGELESRWMPRLFLAVSDMAGVILQQAAPDFDVYVGNKTDPDGHEMLVVVPYEDRDKIEKLARKLDTMVYEVVEELF